MKTVPENLPGFKVSSTRGGSRPVRAQGAVSALLVMGATLLGPGGGGYRAAADPPCPAPAGIFPSGPVNDNPIFSMGVFRVTVNPDFWPLLQANGALLAYPGWDNSSHTLTSPILYDTATQIGHSDANQRFTGAYTTGDIVPVGTGVFADTITIYSDYGTHIPFNFAAAVPTSWEVLTEIQSFNLAYQGSNCACGHPLLPACFPTPGQGPTFPMVKAGKFNNNITSPLQLNRSIGIVQSLANFTGATGLGTPIYDFPAQSFFEVFVEVDLPNISAAGGFGGNTQSTTIFPTTGAALYSDPNNPLIIQNGMVCKLPPGVVYLHGGNTLAVNLYFLSDGPIKTGTQKWWYANDLFGSLTLAGHGTIPGCGTTGDPVKNEDIVIDATLGTNNLPRAGMPIGSPFPKYQYPPSTDLTYDSMRGVNFAGVSWDAVKFSSGPLTISFRNLSLSNFVDPAINFPPLNGSVTYTNTNTVATFETSLDGVNFSPATANGTMEVLITSSNPPAGNTIVYDTEIKRLDLAGSANFGAVFFRQSQNTNSPGKHIVQTGPQVAFITGSFFGFNAQLSTDLANWFNGDHALHIELANPPCGAAEEKLHGAIVGSNVVLSWFNPSYVLQGSASLNPTSWVTIPGTSPITQSATGPYLFYRLSCD